jgi:hypothetical protein
VVGWVAELYRRTVVSLQLKDGGYYRRRDGQLEGPLRTDTFKGFVCHGTTWHGNGRHCEKECPSDLIAEVTVTPALPCELRAGGKYTTQKPDGTAGPLVELTEETNRYRRLFPFAAVHGDMFHAVGVDGVLSTNAGVLDGYRITGEYVEPKPPTPLERLTALREAYRGLPIFAEEMDAIIADIKAEAGK